MTLPQESSIRLVYPVLVAERGSRRCERRRSVKREPSLPSGPSFHSGSLSRRAGFTAHVVISMPQFSYFYFVLNFDILRTLRGFYSHVEPHWRVYCEAKHRLASSIQEKATAPFTTMDVIRLSLQSLLWTATHASFLRTPF
jgi:hypothetical protein